MQPLRPNQRAPGSFSPLPGSSVSSTAAAQAAAFSSSSTSLSSASHAHSQAASRPPIRRIESSSSDDTPSIQVSRSRPPPPVSTVVSPPYAAAANSSTSSLQNFSRPTRPNNDAASVRTASPLTLPPSRGGGGFVPGHSRKHSATQGHFEPSLPSTSFSNLSQIGMASQAPSPHAAASALSPSTAAAQAAFQHQNAQQQHSRHRSQTVPFPGSDSQDSAATKRPGPKPLVPDPRSPPMLSLTEASVPRDHALGGHAQTSNMLGSHSAVATTAANAAFPRTSPQTSPGLPGDRSPASHAPFAPPLSIPDKPTKTEKSKVKLFSRPKKIDTKTESKEKPLPSPGKIGSALASLQRGNYSTTSLAEPSASFYNLGNNSSAATIRPIDTNTEKEGKEKKHHFLSRQKQKLSNKDDFHLPLSSAASNSRPVDPNAPTSLYNFNVPPSPGPNSNLSKSVSGFDLRHGGRALREKRKEDKTDIMRHANESTYTIGGEWPGPSSLGGATTPSIIQEPLDSGKYGLNGMSLDDAWPYLKAKLLVIFEGGDLRLPVEDFNRVVTMHLQYCIQRRSAHMVVEDLADLLSTGFSSLDHTLRRTQEDRLIPALVELWIFTFTNILPYMQAVLLPLDLEFSGNGPLLTPEQAREFWGGVVTRSPTPGAHPHGTGYGSQVVPASAFLDVRRLVLMAYRDTIIIPRYEKLKTIFSRLSLEHLPFSMSAFPMASSQGNQESLASLSTSPSDQNPLRPGTAMSVDPSVGSYNSSSTTLFGEGSIPSRSRAISNVSYASGGSEPQSAGGAGATAYLRPFTPQTGAREAALTPGNLREQNVEDSKQVTEMVGRMLQCMSVLASVDPTSGPTAGTSGSNLSSSSAGAGTATAANGSGGGAGATAGASAGAGGNATAGTDDPSRMVSELGRLLKLNWLGRGRTGRNRRGMVGGRVKREETNATSRSSGSGLAALRESLRDGVGVAG